MKHTKRKSLILPRKARKGFIEKVKINYKLKLSL